MSVGPTVLSFCNHKGGVGKTTSAFNVALCLRDCGKRVLLVDADAQANLSESLGYEEEEDHNLYTVLMGKHAVMSAIKKLSDGLGLLLGSCEMEHFVRDVAGNEVLRGRAYHVLRDLLGEVVRVFASNGKPLDCVVLDSPPQMSLLTFNVLVASDYVFIPMEGHRFSFKGVKRVLGEVRALLVHRPDLKVGGIFLTRTEPHVVIDAFYARTLREEYGELLMETRIRKNVALKESVSCFKSIYDYAPRSHGAADYRRLTQEIMVRVGMVS